MQLASIRALITTYNTQVDQLIEQLQAIALTYPGDESAGLNTLIAEFVTQTNIFREHANAVVGTEPNPPPPPRPGMPPAAPVIPQPPPDAVVGTEPVVPSPGP